MDEIHQIYYSINEVAKELNVSTALLRFWEKELKLEPPIRKGAKKIRKYKNSHISKFKMIKKLLKEEKYTLIGVKKILKEKKNSPDLSELIVEMERIKNYFISLQKESIEEH